MAGRPQNEIQRLTQSGSIQDYRSEIDSVNSCAGILDAAMIKIIITEISGLLWDSMTHNDHPRYKPPKCRDQLVPVNIIASEFQRTYKHPRHDDENNLGHNHIFMCGTFFKAGSVDKIKANCTKRGIVP